MKRIGLLSDTHGYLDPKIFEHFKDCDEIWHAGDFGSIEVSDQLNKFKPLRGVYGNIDGQELRQVHPVEQHFNCEGVDVLIIHIGGKPKNYDHAARTLILEVNPDIFICGHSHLLRVEKDTNSNNMLFINPGAAGRSGLHKVRTIIRFQIDSGKPSGMEAIELLPR